MTTNEERLWESIDEYGVTLEQVGYRGVVTFEMENDGSVLLELDEGCGTNRPAV